MATPAKGREAYPDHTWSTPFKRIVFTKANRVTPDVAEVTRWLTGGLTMQAALNKDSAQLGR